jgi:uncharacterized spore protein YtfJ
VEETMTDEQVFDSAEAEPEAPAEVNFSADTLQATMDKFLATANVDAVFAHPIRHGDTTIINCAEIVAGLGFGVGEGGGTGGEGEHKGEGHGSGGGGGGRTFSRPVAAIVADANGVSIQPIVDVTKLGLAGVTAFGFMLYTLMRMTRGRL